MMGLRLVLPLVFIIAAGNILRGKGFYNNIDIDTLMKTLFWVILPPLMVRSTYIAGKEVLSQPNLLIASTICYLFSVIIAYFAASRFAHKGNTKRIAVSAFASLRSNNVYLGFPVVEIALGTAGLHYASLFLAVTQIPFQFISVASSELILSGRLTFESFKVSVKKIATNPIIVSAVIGITMACFELKIPFVADKAMEIISGSATTFALLALGGTLDLKGGLKRLFEIIRETWVDILVKLIINPAIMYLCLKFFPIPKELFCVSVTLTAMPTAVNTFVMSQAMGMDAQYAADLVAATTILAIVAIPIWATIGGMI